MCFVDDVGKRPPHRIRGSRRGCRTSARRPAPPEVIAGTLAYMAPEQTGPDEPARSIPEAILYSLGITFYENANGDPTLQRRSIRWNGSTATFAPPTGSRPANG